MVNENCTSSLGAIWTWNKYSPWPHVASWMLRQQLPYSHRTVNEFFTKPILKRAITFFFFFTFNYHTIYPFVTWTYKVVLKHSKWIGQLFGHFRFRNTKLIGVTKIFLELSRINLCLYINDVASTKHKGLKCESGYMPLKVHMFTSCHENVKFTLFRV